jgi:hypothetical protein
MTVSAVCDHTHIRRNSRRISQSLQPPTSRSTHPPTSHATSIHPEVRQTERQRLEDGEEAGLAVLRCCQTTPCAAATLCSFVVTSI